MLGLLTSQAGALCLQRRRGARPPPATSSRNRSRSAPKRKVRSRCVISAKIEAEIAVLSREERAEYLARIGPEGTRPRPSRSAPATRCSHLVTYFTVGPKETRAWTITARHQGARRRRASSIPTSRRGFIRAETIAYRRLRRAGRRSRRRAMPASCGSKARTMWSPTAT